MSKKEMKRNKMQGEWEAQYIVYTPVCRLTLVLSWNFTSCEWNNYFRRP